MKSKLIVSGAAGRMGRRILALVIDANSFDIIAGIETANHPDIGKDLGVLAGKDAINTPLTDTWPAGADVVIDFSLPQAADKTIEYCLNSNAALILGTTGLSAEQQKKIKTAAEKIPLIYGTNMGVGMNVMFNLAPKTASMLGDDYDIEIIEQHHRYKKDAPSGSALTLAEKICKSTGRDFPNCIIYGREGKDALREKGTIAIHAIRAGDITGIHSVIFSTTGETITLNHTAHSRDSFAKGALRAAQWLINKKPGSYPIADVLGLE